MFLQPERTFKYVRIAKASDNEEDAPFSEVF